MLQPSSLTAVVRQGFVALLAAIAICLPVCVLSQSARADQIGDLLKAVSAKLSPCVVSVRAVSTVTSQENGQSTDHDITAEFKGVVVSANGLILCTNAYFSGDRTKQAMGVPPDQTGVDISVAPREIRITIGDETTEYYGSVAATDSSLGLAFIQIRDLKGRTLPFVDLTAPANVNDIPTIGDPTASVTRMSKTFDFAPLLVEDRVCAIIDKPRKAYVPEGYSSSLGLPVYGSDGNIIGVATNLEVGDETQEDQSSSFLSRLFDDVVSEDHSQFILPTSVVAPLIGEATTQAAALPPFVIPVPRPVTPPPAKPTSTPTTPTPPAVPSPGASTAPAVPAK